MSEFNDTKVIVAVMFLMVILVVAMTAYSDAHGKAVEFERQQCIGNCTLSLACSGNSCDLEIDLSQGDYNVCIQACG